MDVYGEFREKIFIDKVPTMDQSYVKDPQKDFMVAQTLFNKRKDGSLLDLFESPHMTVHMII